MYLALGKKMENKSVQCRKENQDKNDRTSSSTKWNAANFHTIALQGEQCIQRKENRTGLTDQLKEGIESMSGFQMDDVRVHYNSSKPSQLNAYAYTKGTDIHIAPGQEKYLAHEAWHVVQQKQGRVNPTNQINGENINDSASLEKEADRMGEMALQCKVKSEKLEVGEANHSIMQRALAVDGHNQPFQENIVEISARNNVSIKWVRANQAQLGNGEEDCKRRAMNERHQWGDILNPGGTEVGNAKWWLYGTDEKGCIHVTGYVIRHAHNDNATGTIVREEKKRFYFLNDGIHAGSSNKPVQEVKLEANGRVQSGLRENDLQNIDSRKANVPHYHSADLYYIMDNLSAKKGGINALKEGLIVNKKDCSDVIVKAINELSACHGETGHHVFDVNDIG